MSSTMEIKLQNLDSIRDAIRLAGSGTKAGLSKSTGLSVATCNNLLNEMFEQGELLQVDQDESQGGRKASRFIYNKDYYHVLGIYVKIVQGVRNVGYSIANALGDIIEQEVLHPDWIDCEYLSNLFEQRLARDPLIHSAALAIPGNVYQGRVEYCDIHSLEGLDLQAVLGKKLNINVIVENDMNMIAYGAYWADRCRENCLVAMDFPVDDAVGSGIVIDGKIYKGATRFAGELAFALEEEGIPRTQQPVSKLSKSELFKILVKSVMMVTCVLNPDRIVLMCEALNEDDLPMIRDYCKKFVSEYHIPQIVLSRSFYDFCTAGMIRATLNSLRYQFRLTV